MSGGVGTGTDLLGLAPLGDDVGGEPLRNLGFEEGSNGIPVAWEITNFTARGFFAAFGLLAAEGFEGGWANSPYAFELEGGIDAPFSAALYLSPKSFEDFEHGWANSPFFASTFNSATAVFDAENFEDFEEGWGNDNLTAWPGGTAAVFNAEGFEDFEEGWENTAYLTAWPGGTGIVVSGILAKTVEDFEDVKDPQLYTVDFMVETIQSTAHGLALDYRVIFAVPVAGAMPMPIAPTVPYYVQNVPDADTFKVALLPGAGSPLDITTNGSGLLRWSAPFEFWVTRMATL